MNKKDTITLTLLGYKYTGEVEITTWDNTIGIINMTDFYSTKKLTKKQIINQINDGGFGCRKINKATVYVFKGYDFPNNPPYIIYDHEEHFNEQQCKNCKIGI